MLALGQRIALLIAVTVLLALPAPAAQAAGSASPSVQEPASSTTPTPFPTLAGVVLSTPVAPAASASQPNTASAPQQAATEPTAPAKSSPAPTPGRAGASTANPAPAATAAPEKSGATRYTVQRGDTLYSISRKYGVTVAALQAANGLADSSIKAGQELVIPDGTTPATATPAPSPTASPTATRSSATQTPPGSITISPTPVSVPKPASRASDPAPEANGFRPTLERYTEQFLDAIDPVLAGTPPYIFAGALVGIVNTCFFYFFLGRGFKLFLPYLAIGAAAAVVGVIVGKQLPQSGPMLGEVDLVASSLATWLILFIARSLRL